jgi:hypothetical protein
MLGEDYEQRPMVPSGAALRVFLSVSLKFSTFYLIDVAIAMLFSEA